MEFGWTAAQRGHHERMRALGTEVEALAPPARLAALASGGALGLPLPVDAGGAGLDLVTTAYAWEGLGATLGDAGTLLAAGAHLFGVALPIAKIGTDEQKARWLGPLARGEVLAAVAATEEAAGSNVAAIEASTERTSSGRLVVRGAKRWVTGARSAELFLVVARSPDATASTHGLVTLLVPRAAGGIRVGEPWPVAGLATAGLAPVEIDGAEVGDDAVLGRSGAGLAVFQVAMAYERALVLAFRLGAMERDLDAAVAFAKTRAPGGVPIARHQAVAHRIARMKLRLETARLLTYRAAWELDVGARGQLEAALAKWHVAAVAVESALDAMQLRGGAGLLEPAGHAATVVDALGGTIHSGTEDVLATIVARWLGL